MGLILEQDFLIRSYLEDVFKNTEGSPIYGIEILKTRVKYFIKGVKKVRILRRYKDRVYIKNGRQWVLLCGK